MSRFEILNGLLMNYPFCNVIINYDFYFQGKINNSVKGVEDIDCIAANDEIVAVGYKNKNLDVWKDECQYSMRNIHFYKIKCLHILPDGRIVSGSKDCTIKIHNLNEECKILTGHCSKVRCLKNTSEYLISGGDKLKIWDLESGQCIYTFRGHTKPLTQIATLGDNKIITGSYDTTLRVWNLKNMKHEMCLRGHSGAIRCIYHYEDTIISGSDDCKIKIWKEGICIKTLEGHDEPIIYLNMLPNKQIISVSRNKIKIWEEGKCITTYHIEKINSVAWKDGFLLVSRNNSLEYYN